MFVQSLAVMRQQKVIESGIKVPLCHLSPLLCQYNIFYSLSQLWPVHHSVTQSHTALCTVSPQVGATYRECRSDKGFTVEPNTRPQHHTGLERTKRGLNMSTSHKYKSKSTQRCVWTQAAVQRDTDSHFRSFLTLVLFVPWHKDVCSNALCAHYFHFDLRIISILPLPPLSYCFFLSGWTMDSSANICKLNKHTHGYMQVQYCKEQFRRCW